MARAMSMNLGMLTSYDEIKERLNAVKGTTDAVETRLFASAISGIICSFMSLPFDNAKVTPHSILKGKENVKSHMIMEQSPTGRRTSFKTNQVVDRLPLTSSMDRQHTEQNITMTLIRSSHMSKSLTRLRKRYIAMEARAMTKTQHKIIAMTIAMVTTGRSNILINERRRTRCDSRTCRVTFIRRLVKSSCKNQEVTSISMGTFMIGIYNNLLGLLRVTYCVSVFWHYASMYSMGRARNFCEFSPAHSMGVTRKFSGNFFSYFYAQKL